MSRIKYTIVPASNIEASIFESGVKLSETSTVIDPIIIFNANMELGIETEIYGNDVGPENIIFTTEKSLMKTLRTANDDRFSNTIIVNGFDIDLDMVRNVFAKLAKQSEKIFSINVLSDQRKYTNFTINLTSDIDTEISDEEWEQCKSDYKNDFEESLKLDVKENKIRSRDDRDNDAQQIAMDLLKALYGIDDDIDPDDDGIITFTLPEPIDKSKDEPIKELQKAEKKEIDIVKKDEKSDIYESYTYANYDGMITLERNGDVLFIMDEDDELAIPIEFVDFMIETLKKLK